MFGQADVVFQKTIDEAIELGLQTVELKSNWHKTNRVAVKVILVLHHTEYFYFAQMLHGLNLRQICVNKKCPVVITRSIAYRTRLHEIPFAVEQNFISRLAVGKRVFPYPAIVELQNQSGLRSFRDYLPFAFICSRTCIREIARCIVGTVRTVVFVHKSAVGAHVNGEMIRQSIVGFEVLQSFAFYFLLPLFGNPRYLWLVELHTVGH